MKELCVSKASLAPDGPAPEVGDPVSFEVSGTVARVEGDRYYINADTANGVAVPEGESMEQDEGESMEQETDDAELRGMAEDTDEEAGYP